jgi:hypothetical protein
MLANSDDTAAAAQKKHCLELIRKGQSRGSGWGLYVTSPPEPFDTAEEPLRGGPQPAQGEPFTPLRRVVRWGRGLRRLH